MSSQQDFSVAEFETHQQPALALAQSPEDLYTELVRDRIEERAKRVDHDITARARHLAEAYGTDNATPRDVVDLHLAVVARLTRASKEPRRVKAVVASSQLVLVEVLGHLASHYRSRAGACEGT